MSWQKPSLGSSLFLAIVAISAITELLRGRWRGFHSIRLNEQRRVVFRWSEGQAHEVDLIDCHRG